MARNWYSEALDIISSDNVDYKKISVAIAKIHPKVLVDAYNSTSALNWQERCRSILQAGDKIGAIKLCRGESGMNLREAKDYVESLV